MAKALTIVLLLAATAAFAAAHPGLGKGGILSNIVVGNATTGTASPPVNATVAGVGNAKSITINKDVGDIHGGIHGQNGCDLGHKNCKWRDECRDTTRKECKEFTIEKEVCRNVTKDEQVEVCEKKCFKADKIITIGHMGKGRRLLNADSINIAPHIAHAVINKDHNDGGNGGQQEVCRDICRPQTNTSTTTECKPEKKTELKCDTIPNPPVCRRICECNIDIGKIIGKGH